MRNNPRESTADWRCGTFGGNLSGMHTTLNAEGEIGIPDNIRRADCLSAGDSFELHRLTSGCYVLTKQPGSSKSFTTVTGEDGLPVIRAEHGRITASLVREIESATA